MKAIEKLKYLFEQNGNLNYGENITQKEHAVQCYYLAKQAQSTVEICVAAFLHDVGHLLYDEENVKSGIDFHHEVIGADFLMTLGLNDSVLELIRSHVWAKRYIITKNPEYLDQLSRASVESFYVQGGKMSTEEFENYSKFPNLNDCIQLRYWDDEGKIEGMDFDIPFQVWEDIEKCLK